ncbi:MAG: hypothetical protein RLZ25_904 [Pseudomonadota bacterium]|jgi:hypothetical protein
MKKKNISDAHRIAITMFILAQMIPNAMSMEDVIAPAGANPSMAKSPTKKHKETRRSSASEDDQVLGGRKQESLRAPATPNGLVNPCQMADSPKWCNGE